MTGMPKALDQDRFGLHHASSTIHVSAEAWILPCYIGWSTQFTGAAHHG